MTAKAMAAAIDSDSNSDAPTARPSSPRPYEQTMVIIWFLRFIIPYSLSVTYNRLPTSIDGQLWDFLFQ